MVFRISLDNGFSGKHIGLVFAHGEARTEDAFLATRLQSKGYHVAAETVAADEAVSDQGEAAEAPPFFDEEIFEADGFTPQDFEKMTVDALKKYAEEKKIDLGSAKLKGEIITVISAAVSKPETA